jgi:hypothetical protein
VLRELPLTGGEEFEEGRRKLFLIRVMEKDAKGGRSSASLKAQTTQTPPCSPSERSGALQDGHTLDVTEEPRSCHTTKFKGFRGQILRAAAHAP